MAFRIALVYSGFGGMAQALWAGLRTTATRSSAPRTLGFEPPLSPDFAVKDRHHRLLVIQVRDQIGSGGHEPGRQ
jgi:hypothetical protein